MILATTDSIAGRAIVEYKGFVRGSSVRGHDLPSDLASRMHGLVGGEIPAYTQLLAQVREEALDRMVAEAKALGADAIVGLRYASTEIATGAAEMLCYGTAVKLA